MSSPKVEPVKKPLELPSGQWQLFSYGQLTAVPTAKQAIWIKGFLRRVEVDSRQAISNWTAEIKARDLPVGEMVAWPIGTIFDGNSTRVSAPQAIGPQIRVEHDLKVEFTNENCRLVRRFDQFGDDEESDGLFGGRGISRNSPSANTYFLHVSRGPEPALLIPCTTVIQTFWSCSSNFLHMLLDSRFLDFDMYVINMAKSRFDREAKHAYLWLRQWSLDLDARFLASIAFDPVAVARGRAISARLQSTAGLYSDEFCDRYLAALPPYTQPMLIKAQVMPVNCALGSVLYVQRILSTSYRPDFEKLLFDRDNDGRPPQRSVDAAGNLINHTNANRPKIDRPRNFVPRNEAKCEYSLAQDHPNFQTLAGPLQVGRFDKIFGGLSEVEVEKLPQLEPNYRSGDDPFQAIDKRWDGQVSTLPPSSRSSVSALAVVLTSGNAIVDTLDEGMSPVGRYLDSFIEEFQKGQCNNFEDQMPEGVTSITIEPVFPWLPNLLFGGSLLFSLPSEVEDYRWAYLYADPGSTVRKRAVCLKVTFYAASHTSVGYILEIEGRYPKPRASSDQDKQPEVNATPILFFWKSDHDYEHSYTGSGTTFSVDFLQDLILRLVQESGDAAVEYARRNRAGADTRKHNSNGLEFKKLLAELYKRI